jgi:hypothetical protein
MAMVEGMGDIKNSQIYVNPINGMVSVAKTKTQKINGKDVTVMDSDPNKFMTVNELRNYMKIKIDKFKTSAIDADVEKVGVKVDETMTQGTLTKLGKIISITNPALVDTLNPNEKKEVANFQAYVTDLANVRVEGDPFAALSILRDYVGANPNTNKPYSVSFDKKAAAADPNTIYLEKNSNGTFTPSLTDEQKEVARDFVKRRIYNEIDQKREVKATQYRPYPPQPSEASIINDERRTQARNLAYNLADMLTGDEKKAKNALGYLRSQNIFAQKEGSNIYMYDKAGKKISFNINNETDKKDFIRRIVGAANPENLSQDLIVQYANERIGNNDFSTTGNLIGYGYKASATEAQDIDIPSRVVEDDGVATADRLNQAYKGTGYSFKTSGGIVNQGIFVSNDNGLTWSSQEFPINTQEEIENTGKSILSWMQDNPAVPAP